MVSVENTCGDEDKQNQFASNNPPSRWRVPPPFQRRLSQALLIEDCSVCVLMTQSLSCIKPNNAHCPSLPQEGGGNWPMLIGQLTEGVGKADKFKQASVILRLSQPKKRSAMLLEANLFCRGDQ